MLRILRIDLGAHRAVLILQGHIVAEWASLLEHECLELHRAGRRVALDLSGVGFVGYSGFETLGRLDRAGVGILGCSPVLADELEEEGIGVGFPRRKGGG